MEGQGGWLNLLVERSYSTLSEFFSTSVLITTPEKSKEPSSTKEEGEMLLEMCKQEEQAKDAKNSFAETPGMFYPCKGESSYDFPDDELSGEISINCSRFFYCQY